MGLCENCHNFKLHGTKCYFYWEKKKACSQFKRSHEDEPQYRSELIQIT